MPRRTFDQIRTEAALERDLRTADFLDGYADLVAAARGPRAHPEGIKGPLTIALRGLASSIRAGLVDG